MKYARIYEQFIASRRASPAPSGYSEEHHIVPRSLGGTDDPENLIRLTPEDHYFAHCCLAKIYGGTQWASVVMMGLSRKDGKRWHIRARYMYGAARRRYAQESSARQTGQPGRRGADNGMHDPTVHSWTNVDTGETRFATKSEMWLTVGGCRAQLDERGVRRQEDHARVDG